MEIIGTTGVSDAPVIAQLQACLQQAVARRASDVHFEPHAGGLRVRMRIDGELIETDHWPLGLRERLAARVKVLAHMDVAERRLPQDGRMVLKRETGHDLDLRVSSLPTLHGEKIVIRVLDGHQQELQLAALGYTPEQLRLLKHAIAQPCGMVLVTGPTGSGKTQSLYACLQQLNTPSVNISTVEDPCEIELPGLNQVPVQDKPGLGFATVLRALLRQDPDVLMVGEIRDVETAQVAFQAAQTGHLVLSTLHTNDAPSTLERLAHMGIPPYLIAASVQLITAQRLVRRLCVQCRQPEQSARWVDILRQAGWHGPLPERPSLWQAQGCSACHRGYRGRVGVFEVMPVSRAMQAQILRNPSGLELAAQAAKEGIATLRQSGLALVLAGVTSLQEVLSGTPEIA